MKKFCIRRNKDAGLAFENSLLDAGYEYVKHYLKADFLLLDCEGRGEKRENVKEFLNDRCVFVYPHTPLTAWLWDGVYEPLPVDCNFVYSRGALEIMELYGYPNRIEVVGFPRCEILPFRPTTGSRLLFVPARPRKDGGKHSTMDDQVLKFILDHSDCFESITICTIKNYAFPDLEKNLRVNVVRTDPKATLTPTQDMVERIDEADLVIAVHTTGSLAVARGKPTIFYGQHEPPDTVTGLVPKNYEKYRHLLQYPLTIEDMNIHDILDVRRQSNQWVEKWKDRFIGFPFDPERFLKIIKECLRIE